MPSQITIKESSLKVFKVAKALHKKLKTGEVNIHVAIQSFTLG